ncbi:DUF861 domain-containing protein [bacterium]|nr:DUF861 domain-containing protein [bacterium]
MRIIVEKPSQEKLDQLKVEEWPIWEKEVSEFDWDYSDKETCYILEGDVIVKTKSPLKNRLKSFRCNVIEVNGHDFEDIVNSFENALKFKEKKTVIIAHTIKGKGVSFMEDNPAWHGKPPNKAEFEKSMRELKK